MHKLSWHNYIAHEDQALAIHATYPEVNVTEHEHEFDELVIVDSGSGTHVCNGQPRFIQTGDVFFVRHSDAHFYSDLGELCLTNILSTPNKPFNCIPSFAHTLSKSCAGDLHHGLWVSRSDRPAIKSVLAELSQSLSITEPRQAVRREGYILQLLSMISQRVQPVGQQLALDARSNVDRLLAYINAHCTQDFDWERVGVNFGISSRNLYRILKKETGRTPDAYLNHLRLSYAQTRLLNSQASITEIAFSSGFNNISHFCRSYRNAFGLTPGDQRRLRQSS